MDELIEALGYVLSEYKDALGNKNIHKPVSWALYRAWEYIDSVEKERKDE